MSVESVTQAVSNLALQFGDDDADPGAMVKHTRTSTHACLKINTTELGWNRKIWIRKNLIKKDLDLMCNWVDEFM